MPEPNPAHREAPYEVAADARDRAWRTFLQGLVIDVALASSLVIGAVAADTEINWRVAAASLARSVVQAGASFVHRYFAAPKTPGR